jgi:hypothetical protein
MRFLSLLLAIFLFGCTRIAAPSAMMRPDAQTQSVFRQLGTDLQNAIGSGNRDELERLLAPSFVFVHSTGKNRS